MFGAPAGGFPASGHHGFEFAIVLPIVPPKALSPPAPMPSPFNHGDGWPVLAL